MAIRSRVRGGGSVSMCMTPMIDVVFQLILFFMLVVQFHRLVTEPVTLPPASRADPKTKELKQYYQLVVNVLPPAPGGNVTRVLVDHNVIVESIDNGPAPNWQPLIDLLKSRKLAAEKMPTAKPVNVILRAGTNVPYETIGSVMLCASHAGIQNWWVQAFRPKMPIDAQALRELGLFAPVEGGQP